MPEDRPTGAPIPFATWLASVHEILGTAGGAELTADERDVLLDIARIAAHTSERIDGPTDDLPRGRRVRIAPAR